MKKSGFFEGVKRNVFHSKQYTTQEIDMMAAIHNCFLESLCGAEIPTELRMGDDQTAQHEISTQDRLKTLWDGRLLQGLLYTEAQELISDITEYTSLRAEGGQGNPNDPWNLVCYELLLWLTRNLSGAKCNKETLSMVKKRCEYLTKLVNANIFDPKDDRGERTMLGVLTSMRNTIQQKIIPIIDQEIANSHVREHLAELKMLGKLALNYGFQFLYFIFRKTEDPPAADITQLFDPITETRSGQLLQSLIQSSPYGKIFESEEVLDTKTPKFQDQIFKLQEQAFSNPFIDENNAPCIPKKLRANIRNCELIAHYFDSNSGGSKVDQTGIYKPFREDQQAMEDFVEMHALLIELAKTFIACDEAYKSAGIGGDLLVYGASNKLINELMSTLKKLCQALSNCHDRLKTTARKQEVLETKKIAATLSKPAEAWLNNYRKLPSINTQLQDSLICCTSQANFVQTKSNEISVNKRLEIAQQQTLYFAETATLLSSHVDDFLTRQPSTQKKYNPTHFSGSSPIALSPARSRSATSPLLRTGQSSEKAPTHSGNMPKQSIVMGQKNSRHTRPNNDTSETVTTRSILTTLDFRGSKAKQNNPLTRIIADNSIKYIIQILETTPYLKKLQLKDNKISARKAELLWDALSKCNHLTALNLQNNPQLFSLSSSSSEQQNNLSSTETISASKAFSELLKNVTLQKININSCGLNELSAALIANGLSENTSIKMLDIGGNAIGNNGIEHICRALEHNPVICDLRIAYCKLTDTGAQHVLKLITERTKIIDLMIEDTGISDEVRQRLQHQLALNRQKRLDEENPFHTKADTRF